MHLTDFLSAYVPELRDFEDFERGLGDCRMETWVAETNADIVGKALVRAWGVDIMRFLYFGALQTS